MEAGSDHGTRVLVLAVLGGHHYRIHWLCRVPVTLDKGQFALGKCYTRQTPLGKASHGKGVFAESLGTPQKQPRGATLGRHFAE